MKKPLFAICLLASVGGMSFADTTPQDVAALIHQLKTGDIDEKERAAETLGKLGPEAEPAIGALQETLNHELPYVRMRSAEALAKIGTPALPALIKAMKNVNVEVRAIAAKALGKWGQNDDDAISALTSALRDKELQVRGAAALSLGEMGASAQSAIPALREAAKDADSSVAEKATEALSRVTAITIGKKEEAPPVAATQPPPEVKPAAKLIPMKKKAPAVHPKIVKKAKVVPPPPPPPTPEELIARLQSTDIFVRADAETAIVQRSSETTPLLLQMLQGTSTTQAELSVDLLGKIGTDDAKKALDAYHKRQGDKRMIGLIRDLRQEGKASDDASMALEKMGAESVIPVTQVLSDPKPASRLAAAKVLNRLGMLSAPAANALITTLDDADPEVRAQSAEALAKINSPEARGALRFFPIKDKLRRLLAIFKH